MTYKVLASLAVLAAVGTTAARADFRDFGLRCSPGALRTCVNISVTTTQFGSTTAVHIRIRNWAGSYIGDLTGGSLITRLGIVAPTGITSASGLVVSAGGGTTVTGTPASSWFLKTPGGLGNMIELTAGITPGTKNGGIAGCLAPRGGYGTSYFSTCAAGGYVDFSFTTSNVWSAKNAELAWLVEDVNNPVKPSGIECDTDPNNAGRAVCAAVTPEPVTMVLLGSGLASMGGFGLVRRRRNKDVVNG